MDNSVSQLAGPGSERENQRLFFLAGGIVAAAVAYYAVNADIADPVHRQLGLIMLVLSAFPALAWTRNPAKPFPAFEVFSLTCANTFALPLLNGHEGLAIYESSTITRAAIAVIAYQVALILSHSLIRGEAGRSKFWTESMFADKFMRYIIYGTVISTAYAIISTFYLDLIPNDLVSIIRAICFGVGIVCTFLAARLWGMGRLKPGEKLFLGLNLVIQVGAQIATLYLIQGISVLVLFSIGYVVGSRKLPIVLLTSGLALIAILHNGKSAMRAKYWEGDIRMTPAIGDTPAFFQEWVTDGLSTDPDKPDEAMAVKLVDRTSLFHIMCLVVDRTPELLPYLEGDTYTIIPSVFIPRFFWPNKPLGHAATYQLSVYYGLIVDTGIPTTSIGFGMQTEAYANFGLFGVVLLGAVQGMLFKKVRRWSENSPMVSYGGILQVLLMAWAFQTEYTAAAWIGSFYQACITVLGIPFILRNFLG